MKKGSGTISRVMSSRDFSSDIPTGCRGGRSHLSKWRLAILFGARAAYPPAMDEQPIVETDMSAPRAGIHGLATHKTCGMLCRHSTRWALTPPFHHYRPLGWLLFSVTLLCRHRQLTVREYGALCCPDFPLAAQAPEGHRQATRPSCCLVMPLSCKFRNNI